STNSLDISSPCPIFHNPAVLHVSYLTQFLEHSRGFTGVGLTASVLFLALTPFFPPSALFAFSFAFGSAVHGAITLPLTGSLALNQHSSLHKYFVFELKLFRAVANQLGLLPAKPSLKNDRSQLISNPSTSPYTLYSSHKGKKTPILETPSINTSYSINR
ncbi:MAG: hypothetical protein HKM04_08830, partial [Legionellales bacterium]|nr:hypothetical protein [Legionellales bacterium]